MRVPPKLQPWFDARKRLNLSHASIQMARELGMNPKKLGRLVPAAGEQWKAPLPEFIAHCYEKSQGRLGPEKIRSLEQIIEDEERRKIARRERKAQEGTSGSSTNPVTNVGPPEGPRNEA